MRSVLFSSSVSLFLSLAACAGPALPPRASPVSAKQIVAAAPPVLLVDFEVPWPTVSPEEVGLSRPVIERLVAECQKTDSDALLVLSGNRVVVARTFGHAPRPLDTKSVTEGFVGFAIGFLVAEGKLSIDAPLSTWFPEWKEGKKAKVLLRHVLTHTSGLSHEPMAWRLESQKDRLAYVRALDIVTEPGATYSYNNEASMLLSGVIAAAAGEPIDTYLAKRLIEPLGINDASWSRDGAGNVTTNGGLSMSAVSMAKVGVAVRDGRVVPASWIAAMQEPAKNAPWIGLLTWTDSDGPWLVQDARGRAVLEKNGFASAGKLTPLDNKRFRSSAAYWMEAGALLSPDERATLAAKLSDDVWPLATTKATSRGFYWSGWLGQFLMVLPKAGLVVVRQRRQPATLEDDVDEKIGTRDLPKLVHALIEP